jgi:hypothetical protein
MQIPSKFKVRRKQYTVEHRKRMPLMVTGRLYVHSGVLQIGTASTNKPLTFWHEVTHAILHDMNHPLWDNEEFVTQFSKRLLSVVKTAEFT